MELVSLVIINYNNKEFLERCFTSIFNQSYENIEIVFIDNESKDNSYEYIKELYPNSGINFIRNDKNNGYAGAANQGIKLCNGKYIMILNPDIIMEKDFIEKMYEFIDGDDSIAALSGKLLKYDFENNVSVNFIDSAGIEMFKSTRCVDRGQNEPDEGQYDVTEQVFGVCGAAPLYRKSALDVIKVMDEYFDEDFFAYKEDVDLSWRLNLAGYKNMYYPKAVAYHGRGLGGSKKGILNFIKNRKSQSQFLRGISTRNHRMMICKNDINGFGRNYKKNIIKRELAFFLYSIVFETFSLKYYKQAKELEPRMLEKRNILIRNLGNKVKNIDFLIK